MEIMGKQIPGTADNSSAVARTVDHAAGSAHKAINSASDAARPAVDHLASSAHHAVDTLASAANNTATSIDEKNEKLREVSAHFSESCSSYVRENPAASLGIAVGVGFLLSWALSKR
jgi:ElaB/YqjD/DUF883 family membrane-anchored ribosome-binding protein